MSVLKVVQLKIEDLDCLVDLAEQFFSESMFLKGFDKETARRSWSGFINSGIGVIFGLKGIDGFHGMLGALRVPDVHTGELIASELFWFVDKNKRGKGLLLLKAYEEWAKVGGCKRIAIGHLEDLTPRKLELLYVKMGYTLSEKTYMKEVV